MQIKGKIHTILETKQISERFRKRDIVIEYADNPMYPQYISIQFTQDNVEKLEGCAKGDMVEIDINIRGREWTSPQGEVKYFNTIEGWRITNTAEEAQVLPSPDPIKTPTAEDFATPEQQGLPF